MEPTPELARQLDADRREAADLMTFEQRALAGVGMFDLLVEVMRMGIRMQHPDASEDAIENLLIERLRTSRKHEARI